MSLTLELRGRLQHRMNPCVHVALLAQSASVQHEVSESSLLHGVRAARALCCWNCAAKAFMASRSLAVVLAAAHAHNVTEELDLVCSMTFCALYLARALCLRR